MQPGDGDLALIRKAATELAPSRHRHQQAWFGVDEELRNSRRTQPTLVRLDDRGDVGRLTIKRPAPMSLREHIRAMVRSGDTVGAVKLVRADEGLTLEAATRRVAEIAAS